MSESRITAEQTTARWLTENTVSWSLEVNPERLVYAARRDYLVDQASMLDDDPPENLEALVAADNLYEARAYPTSAVGFVIVHETTLESALARLAEDCGWEA